MNVDRILETFNSHHVAYILIGGMNFLLRHEPVLTYDVDLWIEDLPENRDRCERALGELKAEWGASDDDWGPVAEKGPGWLTRQGVFCLTSPHGALDVFRSVKGQDSWAASRKSAYQGRLADGTAFTGLSDADMIRCQMALPENLRKRRRLEILNEAIRKPDSDE